MIQGDTGQEEKEGNTNDNTNEVETGEVEEEGGGTTKVLIVTTPTLSKGVTVMEGGAMIGAAKGTSAATMVDRETETS